MRQEYDCIIIGGLADDSMGRPLGPYRLRTALKRNGYNGLVVDCGWALDSNEMMELLSATVTEKTSIIGLSSVWFRPSTVGKGYTATGVNEWYSKEFFDQVKKKWPWVKIVLGGGANSPNENNINIDFLVMGYADKSIIILLNYLKGAGPRPKMILEKFSGGRNIFCIDSNVFYIIEDINDTDTEFDATDYWEPWQPIPLQASRGCVFECAFCTHPFLGRRNFDYIRSPENIAAEMMRNYELFGTTRYLLMDDTLNDSMEKLQRLLKARELSKLPNFEMCAFIRPELLVTKPEMIPILGELGLKGGFVGLESLGKEARRSIGKGMDVERIMPQLEKMKSDYKVQWQTGMIVGLPGDTSDDVVKYYERLKSDNILYGWSFTPLAINAGTLIGKDPAKYGYTLDGNEWTNNVGMTRTEGKETAKLIGERSNKEQSIRAGGWEVGAFWYHNALPGAFHRPLSQFRYRKIGAIAGRQRAVEFLVRIKEQQLEVSQ